MLNNSHLLHGQGASLKEMIRESNDAIFLCIAPGLFSDYTPKSNVHNKTI